MRKVYPADYWPNRKDEPVQYIYLNELAGLEGSEDGYFPEDVARARWRAAYRAARLAFRDRAPFHLPPEYRRSASRRLGRIVRRALGATADSGLYVRAVEIALNLRCRDHDWQRLYSALTRSIRLKSAALERAAARLEAA